jgi:hypothetical protein
MAKYNQKRRDFFSKLAAAGIGTALAGSSLKAKGGKQSTEMSEEQKDTLFYIFQEEKVARDVYITLGEKYQDESTFALIQLSEQNHIESAQKLCEKYGVDTSYVNLDMVGYFELPVLQELYDTCVAQGRQSLLDALRVGELIEITDIEDLENAAEGMPADVVRTYENLKEGSLNHLEAFRTSIARATA